MASKKLFWLKLHKDFFRTKELKKLRSIAGGDVYTIIYLKLQLLSLENNGVLYYDGIGDTFTEELALEIDEDAENIKILIAIISKMGLLDLSKNDEITVSIVTDNIGSETPSASRKRKQRSVNNQRVTEKSGTMSQKSHKNVTTEIELELDLETELETELEKNKTPRGREVGGSCFPFNEFWNAYGKKIDSKKCKSKYSRISEVDREVIKSTVNGYVLSTPDVKFRKNPLTYLNGDVWNDVVVESPNMSNMAKKQLQECPTVNNNRDWIV